MSRHEKQCNINSTVTTAACYCLILSLTHICCFFTFFSWMTRIQLLFRSLLHFFTHSVVSQLRKIWKKVKHKIWVNLIYILFSLSLAFDIFRLLTVFSMNECWWRWWSEVHVKLKSLFIFNFILKSFTAVISFECETFNINHSRYASWIG